MLSKKKSDEEKKGLTRKNGSLLIGEWYKFIYVITRNSIGKLWFKREG